MRHLLDVRPASAPPYPVWCGRDPAGMLIRLWDPRWRRAVLIGDTTTSSRFAPPLEAALRDLGCEVLSLDFPAGESSKTRATKERLEDAMLAAHVDRAACIVGIGGGVALDLAGFVAATYLRGVAHIHVATTLLAQVDAAIGGKTGVDTPRGKNLIGAFHPPRGVVIDVAALDSLPRRELRNGLAEAVKHAVLRDASLFDAIEAWAETDAVPSEELVGRCVAIKAAIVDADEREQGLRSILNFGHTVAHAIEAATEHRLPHGEAVAIGMVVEAAVASRSAAFPEHEVARLRALLERIGLPTAAPCSFDEAEPFFLIDKKSREGRITCALPTNIGSIAPHDGSWTRTVTVEDLRKAWC